MPKLNSSNFKGFDYLGLKKSTNLSGIEKIMPHTEAVFGRYSIKKMFLEILQNPQKNTCTCLFFHKVTGLRPGTLLKNKLWHRCFPVNFARFVKIPFLTEHVRWLLLPTSQYSYQSHCILLMSWKQTSLRK